MAGTIIVDKVQLDVGQDTLRVFANTGSTIFSANTLGINAASLGFGTLPSGRLPTIPRTNMPTGAVLQALSATKTDTFTTVSTSWVDITGLSVSITPTSATSKILIFASLQISNATVSQGTYFRFVRDSTPINIGDAIGSRSQVTNMSQEGSSAGRFITPMNSIFLDSPATTSATTYKLQTNCLDAGTICINRSGGNTDGASYATTVSSITVMEIAA
jgi:hypothetical protein